MSLHGKEATKGIIENNAGKTYEDIVLCTDKMHGNTVQYMSS